MDLSNLTLTQLRYLVAVDRHRSFRFAAEHCHVSQPALSMQIGKLEELLGLTVFDRSRQPVVPTERGLRWPPRLAPFCARRSDSATLVRDRETIAGRYRLGVLPSLASTLVPLFLPELSRPLPGRGAGRRGGPDRPDDSRDFGRRAGRRSRRNPARCARARRAGDLFREPFYVYFSPRHPLLAQARIQPERPHGRAALAHARGPLLSYASPAAARDRRAPTAAAYASRAAASRPWSASWTPGSG